MLLRFRVNCSFLIKSIDIFDVSKNKMKPKIVCRMKPIILLLFKTYSFLVRELSQQFSNKKQILVKFYSKITSNILLQSKCKKRGEKLS